MFRPYIGITGVETPTQAQHLLNIFDQRAPARVDVSLHLGLMMSYKTLHGLPTQWANVFPKKESLRGVFAAGSRFDVLTCLHYADYDGIDVEDSLVETFSYVCPEANSLQLDMIWPDPDAIAAALLRGWEGDSPTVILQVGRAALEAVHRRPNELVNRLSDYEGVVDCVLLDESGGEGRPIQIGSVLPLAQAIARNCSRFKIAFAGGLGPDTIKPVAKELLTMFPMASFDAQKNLCTNSDVRSGLDLTRCARYLWSALEAYGAV